MAYGVIRTSMQERSVSEPLKTGWYSYLGNAINPLFLLLSIRLHHRVGNVHPAWMIVEDYRRQDRSELRIPLRGLFAPIT